MIPHIGLQQRRKRSRVCFGCGTLNAHGLHIKSRWEADELVCVWQPRPEHIGYPGTVYGGTIASWYVCLKKLKRVLLTRVVPLISVFAAFAFVVMMFNLPLPGGTTGHALGVTIAAIVLGPAGGVLASSPHGSPV